MHWLRARAQQHRWDEEVVLVRHEMEWTARYFLYNMKLWDGRKECRAGPAAYAARKAAMWHVMAQHAEEKFTNANALYFRFFPTI